ncbi:MAG: 50S ribosomal protein L4 [Acidobacteriota bacterium]|jgi:large subunit ribosomal protein L4|nr:50S ribosomal protein L4 [Acidobacteriota bacterium]NLT32908.1 50S ribosomal protein L4 [Acidobacteriota bacterium]
MAEIEVKNLANEVVGKIELSDEVFKAEFNQPLIWEAVKHYNDSLRAGTASTKVRGEVRGSGKKLWRQKGTGRARIGSARSPLWRHGGTVHGPKPRDYGYRFPRKKLRGAMRSALSAKLRGNSLTVVESMPLEGPKTKEFVKILQGFGFTGRILVVDSSGDRNLMLALRNLPGVKLVPGTGVNIYDVVNSNVLLFSKESILKVQEVLSR